MLPSLISQLTGRAPSSETLVNEFLAREQKQAAATSAVSGAATAKVPAAAVKGPVPGSAGALLPPNQPGSLVSATPAYSQSLPGFRLDQYRTLDEIYAFVDGLARRYPKRVHVFTVGRTGENRPIKAIELINNATDPDYVWLDALTHAREWITGTTMLYTLDKLVGGGGGGGGNGAREPGKIYAKNYIIIPVVNPDGFAYTWSTNRMWRKNRSKSPARSLDSKCVGVSAANCSLCVSTRAPHPASRSMRPASNTPHHQNCPEPNLYPNPGRLEPKL